MFLKSLVSCWLAIVIDHLLLPFINLFTHYDFVNVFSLLKRLSTIIVHYFDVQMVLDLILLICFKKSLYISLLRSSSIVQIFSFPLSK